MVRLETRKPPAVLPWADWRPWAAGPEKRWDPVGARGMLCSHPLPPWHLSTTHLLSRCHQIEESSPFWDQTLPGFQERCGLGAPGLAESTLGGSSLYRRTWSLFNPPACMWAQNPQAGPAAGRLANNMEVISPPFPIPSCHCLQPAGLCPSSLSPIFSHT